MTQRSEFVTNPAPPEPQTERLSPQPTDTVNITPSLMMIMRIVWNDVQATLRQHTMMNYLVVFMAGVVFGLVVLGWWLWPVSWVGFGPEHLSIDEQQRIVGAVSDLYAYNLDIDRTRELLTYWHGDELACRMALQTNSWAESMRLQTAAFVANGGAGCHQYWSGSPDE